MAYTYPGLYLEEVENAERRYPRTAVPVFLGHVRARDAKPSALTHWSQFVMRFGEPLDNGYLAYAVRGFFENGGKLCYVVPMEATGRPEDALRKALRQAEQLEEPDLVCAPDLMARLFGDAPPDTIVRLQAMLMRDPEQTGTVDTRRFVILDSLPDADAAREQKHCSDLLTNARNIGETQTAFSGAGLYFPWLAVPRMITSTEPAGVGDQVETLFVPPCGHVAGVYARTDESIGIRKAPANEPLYGVLDLSSHVSDSDQGSFFVSGNKDVPAGAVNCIRALPGRGIRIWGARTLSVDPDWRYINVRRLFLTAIRWIERRMVSTAFEPNGPELWPRIRRELNSYCFELFRRGALKGTTINEAFYVRCDETTNPSEMRENGIVMAEVGLAAARPHEFIVIRLVHKDSGISVTGAGAASF